MVTRSQDVGLGSLRSFAAAAASLAFVLSCGAPPKVEPSSGTSVTVTKGEWTEEAAPTGSASQGVGGPAALPAKTSKATTAAVALDPAAKPALGAATPLVGGNAPDAPLPLPTTVAATRSAVFAFGRTSGGYVVRVRSTKWTDKNGNWSNPVVVTSSFDDDAAPAAAPDGDVVYFAVSASSGGNTRVVRVDAAGVVTVLAPKADGSPGTPAKLGRVAVVVPLKSHLALVGQDGGNITLVRLDRNGSFGDGVAKLLGQGSIAAKGVRTRSPRAVADDDRVLVAWDGQELPGALESPGTTPEEKAAAKPGIYIRRFDGNGVPASPLRRLTRPGFEAHTLDVVTELGACAILGATDKGFEMFRFVRKTTDLGPYGGGLFLASAAATGTGFDISLSTDAVGTLAVSSQKLLRIGPGVKIVATDLPFKPPVGGSGSFDEVRVAPDGSGAHVYLGSRGGFGLLPTIARLDGEKMGPLLPTPWIGPPPQRLVLAIGQGKSALALVLDSAKLHAVRLDDNGAIGNDTLVPWDPAKLDELTWSRPKVPRAVLANGEWVISLTDGRIVVLTGPAAGKTVAIGAAPGSGYGGEIALIPDTGKKGLVRAVFVPIAERSASLATASLDPTTGLVVEKWSVVEGSELHYGALGNARFTALPRAAGGLYLLTSSGPKVTFAAQLFGLVTLDGSGFVLENKLETPAPVQDLSLAPSTGGAVLLVNLTGPGVAAQWLDLGGGFQTSFAYSPFRLRGDGPLVRDKTALILPAGALPFSLEGDAAALVGERCPHSLVMGPRRIVFVCQEGSGSSPLAARVTTHALTF